MPRLSDCLLAAGNGKVTGHVNGKTFLKDAQGWPRVDKAPTNSAAHFSVVDLSVTWKLFTKPSGEGRRQRMLPKFSLKQEQNFTDSEQLIFR
jgi:hypothetical protein